MSVTRPSGFVASGVSCGIKSAGALDLALVATEDGAAVPAAGVFTTNLAAAAPVVVTRAHLVSTGGRASAVVVSSGNANAGTGDQGVADAERICALAADGLGVAPAEVLLCQTGLIGIPLPMKQIESGVAPLVEGRAGGEGSARLAAEAMMTTDTIRKEIVVAGPGFTVGGMAKGAAMLAPQMVPPDVLPHATMLAVLTTDARCESSALVASLAGAVDSTFNRMTLDGCASTNDTVLVFASGASGITPEPQDLRAALQSACASLSEMMAGDAEGGTKVARISVSGAVSGEEAHRAARRVAESSLVKCSLNGEDPYWGRVMSELGSSGVTFEPQKLQIAYGPFVVCEGGTGCAHDQTALRDYMKQSSLEISCDLGLGSATATILTCDLGYGYIDENRTTS